MGVNYKRLLRDKELIKQMVERKVDIIMSNDRDKVRRSLVDQQYKETNIVYAKKIKKN